MTAAEAARIYLDRGWVPLRFGRDVKGPREKGWEKTTRDDVDPRTFNGDNVGIGLGAMSGGLVDGDLDCPEALLLADDFLPPTGMVHGRKSARRSHRWYQIDGEAPRTKQFRAPDQSMIIELRGTGGQTMVPPSWNPDAKEDVAWETSALEPATVTADDLLRDVQRLAAAALLLRHWPAKGGRHNCALALAGVLARGGFPLEDALHFVGAVARAGGHDAHLGEVRGTYAKIENGGAATGLPSFATIVGKPVAAKVAEWLGLSSARKTKERCPEHATLVQILDAIPASNALEERSLTLNEMTGNVEHGGLPIKDAWLTALRAALERDVKLLAGAEETRRAVELIASHRPYHPVREYLNGITWDRRSRLEDFRLALRAEDTALVRAILQCWLVAAVARAYEPGCKVDTMPVLVGEQNLGKSRSIRALAGDWFSDTPIVIGTKDAFSQCRQAWIHEWPELESIRRARDLEAVKAFLSSAADIYRPAYGHYDVRVLRSSIFVGTTNQREFLADETGNRRFWPITVPRRIDVAAIAAMRDQLWAEAVALYRAGERWYLSDEREEELTLVHKAHEIHDAWEEPIADYLRLPTRNEVTTAEVLETALRKPTGQWSTGDARRVSAIMRRLGWTHGKVTGVKGWRRGTDGGTDDRNPSVPNPDQSVPEPGVGEIRHTDERPGTDDYMSSVPPSVPNVTDGEHASGTNGTDEMTTAAPAEKMREEGGDQGGKQHVGGDVAISSVPFVPEETWHPAPPDGARRPGEPSIVQMAEAERHGWRWNGKAWAREEKL